MLLQIISVAGQKIYQILYGTLISLKFLLSFFRSFRWKILRNLHNP